MVESSVVADSDVILPYRFEPDSFGVAARKVTATIPIAKRVLLQDWAKLPGALV